MRAVAAVGILLATTGCAAHTSLGPMGAGKRATHIAVGGPIIKAFGTRIPLPYASAGFSQGLGSRFNLSQTLHLLPLAYKIVGLDFGISWFPIHTEHIDVGLHERVFAFTSLKSQPRDRTFAYPVTSITAATSPGWYAGLDVAGPLPRSAYDPESPRWMLAPFGGKRWRLSSFYLITEVKWNGANVRTDQLSVTYLRIGRNGGLTPLVALQGRF